MAVTGIPSAADFNNAGSSYLNLAWDSVIALSLDLEQSGEHGTASVEDITDEYWIAAQPHLATAVSLAQQGTEFLIKGRIASVSPFLLISGDPSSWPAGCDRQDTGFFNFKTIDAHDLIRAHDTVFPTRLSNAFKQHFEKLRRYRNSVMHTVDPTMRFRAADVLMAVLEVSHALLGPLKWTDVRREYLNNAPASAAWSSDHVEGRLAQETLHVLDELEPALRERYFGVDKSRRYICPHCTYAGREYNPDANPNMAQLRPNTPVSTTLHCFLCNADIVVERKACKHSNCKGNVIWSDEPTCLTCYRDQ